MCQQQEPDDPTGEIHITARVLCGACTASASLGPVANRDHATHKAFGLGWSLNDLHGWTCPACAPAPSLPLRVNGEQPGHQRYSTT